jgi:dihydrofolate reductase
MTVSLDGFVADSTGAVDRLYPDLAALRGTDYMKALIDETGAVIMGRKTFQMGEPDSYVRSYEFQVPIFVLTHQPPSQQPLHDDRLTFTFISDGVESAVSQATAAAGTKAVQVVGGISVIDQLLRAGLVDEVRVDLMPVLLGDGLRMFGSGNLTELQLEKRAIHEVGQRISFRFRVNK